MIPTTKEKQAAEIQRDVARFLRNGGKIQQIQVGATGEKFVLKHLSMAERVKAQVRESK